MLPVGVSPGHAVSQWDDLEAARAGWDVLLEPSLRGRVVLPASPRLVMDLSEHMEAKDALPRLRQQLLTLDDRQGINWLLKDKARVVVVPLQRCMPLLRRDSRITAVIPASGAPLHWTVLVRPVGTKEPLPRAWVESAWTLPLRGRLMAIGWRPPVQGVVDEASELLLPRRWQELLRPPAHGCCWSLPPLLRRSRVSLPSVGRITINGAWRCFQSRNPAADPESAVGVDNVEGTCNAHTRRRPRFPTNAQPARSVVAP